MSSLRALRAALRCGLPLLALLAWGCGNRVLDERWPETGLRRVVGRVETVRGERRATRLWTFWYPDGATKQAQGWFEGGRLPDLDAPVPMGSTQVPVEGRTKRWFFWDSAGTILAEGMFLDGLRDDLWACWKGDGELCCTGFFERGRPTGFHVTWAGGQRRDEHYYADGVLDGTRVVRDGSGAVVWRGEYRRGELVSAEPAGVPAPALHLLERCAAAAEEGRRAAPEDHLGGAPGG